MKSCVRKLWCWVRTATCFEAFWKMIFQLLSPQIFSSAHSPIPHIPQPLWGKSDSESDSLGEHGECGEEESSTEDPCVSFLAFRWNFRQQPSWQYQPRWFDQAFWIWSSIIIFQKISSVRTCEISMDFSLGPSEAEGEVSKEPEEKKKDRFVWWFEKPCQSWWPYIFKKERGVAGYALSLSWFVTSSDQSRKRQCLCALFQRLWRLRPKIRSKLFQRKGALSPISWRSHDSKKSQIGRILPCFFWAVWEFQLIVNHSNSWPVQLSIEIWLRLPLQFKVNHQATVYRSSQASAGPKETSSSCPVFRACGWICPFWCPQGITGKGKRKRKKWKRKGWKRPWS